MEDKSTESVSFFKHVFNFDDDSKAELLNISQYSLLSLVPVLMLNKTIQTVVPEADDSKRSFEMLAEVVGQVVMMFTSIFFINRVITFIPTYSKVKYQEMNLFSTILGFLVIVLSLQTKLGEKVNILLDRLVDRWGGSSETNNQKKQGTQQGQKPGNPQVHQPSQADYIDTQNMLTQPQMNTPSMSNQQVTDFNSMYQGGGGDNGNFVPPPPMEPAAANDGFAAFSSF